MRSIRWIAIGLLLSLFAAGTPALGADISKTARKIYKNHQESVLWVMAVAKIEASAGERTFPPQERKIEALGTVIDATGLTVVSYSALDPSAGSQGRQIGGATLDIKVDFTEVKLRLADGREVPGRIVLKDTDLDLAFVRPDADSEEAEGVTYVPVDLSAAGTSDVLDDAISLGRLDKSLSRRPMVVIGRIAATVKKPRTFYRATASMLGGPVFCADGTILGITVRRIAEGRPGSLVVLPAEDVAEIAEQARKKKPEPKDPEDKPESKDSEPTDETDESDGTAPPEPEKAS